MGNCATKPKVLKDTDEDLIPVDRETTSPTDNNKYPVEKSVNSDPSAADEEEAAAARRCEKGKEILIEDDVEEEHSKRQSLGLLFHEDKAITNLSRNKSGTSSEASKLDTSASKVKAPKTFGVQTRNGLEVKIPEDSKVKTPETPKAKEAEDQEVKFSEELETTKKSEVAKVADLPQVSKVSAPELSQVKVTKESDVLHEVLEDKSVPEVTSPPDLSEIKITKASGGLEVLEDKNVKQVPKVMTDEVKAAESEVLKVSEVTTSDGLEIEVPKVFEVKTPETLGVGSEIKTREEA